jgi:hypothetical protein
MRKSDLESAVRKSGVDWEQLCGIENDSTSYDHRNINGSLHLGSGFVLDVVS